MAFGSRSVCSKWSNANQGPARSITHERKAERIENGSGAKESQSSPKAFPAYALDCNCPSPHATLPNQGAKPIHLVLQTVHHRRVLTSTSWANTIPALRWAAVYILSSNTCADHETVSIVMQVASTTLSVKACVGATSLVPRSSGGFRALKRDLSAAVSSGTSSLSR